MLISVLKHIKINKITPTCFDFKQIIIREYACATLKLLNYLKTEFKIHKKSIWIFMDFKFIWVFFYGF